MSLLKRGLRKLRDLLQAHWALLRAHRAVRGRPAGRLVEVINSGTSRSPARRADAGTVRRLASAVDTAAAQNPLGGTCLVRALALRSLLDARGMTDAKVRVGVDMEGGRLMAHAWVAVDGMELGCGTGEMAALADFRPWAGS